MSTLTVKMGLWIFWMFSSFNTFKQIPLIRNNCVRMVLSWSKCSFSDLVENSAHIYAERWSDYDKYFNDGYVSSLSLNEWFIPYSYLDWATQVKTDQAGRWMGTNVIFGGQLAAPLRTNVGIVMSRGRKVSTSPKCRPNTAGFCSCCRLNAARFFSCDTLALGNCTPQSPSWTGATYTLEGRHGHTLEGCHRQVQRRIEQVYDTADYCHSFATLFEHTFDSV